MRRGLTAKSKRSIGRPSSYCREYCDRIIEAMATGLSAEAGAARIGISARLLFYWQQQHPEFLQAIQEGRQRSQLWWEKRAIALAKGGAGNTQIVMLGLRNRCPCRKVYPHGSGQADRVVSVGWFRSSACCSMYWLRLSSRRPGLRPRSSSCVIS